MPNAEKLAKKSVYFEKLIDLCVNSPNALLVGIDHVASKQMQDIRIELRGNAIVLMGKNTMIRKADHRPREVGQIAVIDWFIPSGPTGMDPSQTAFFQALNIGTKIVKGQIELVSDFQILKVGEKDGTVFSAAVLDISDFALIQKFIAGVANMAAFSREVGIPTEAGLPHAFGNAFRNVAALVADFDFTFKEVEDVKKFLADPSAYAAANPVAAAPASGGAAQAAGAAAKKAEVVEEEEEEEHDFDLFGCPGGISAPAPPELLRFKTPLYMLAAGYGVVVMLGVFSGSLNAALNQAIMLLFAYMMAHRADQCLGQCIMPFFLFAVMTVFFDGLGVIAMFSRDYPGVSQMFSSSCPHEFEAVLLRNTTIYLADAATAGPAAYIVPKDTHVEIPQDACSVAWVMSNVALILGFALDCVASRIGWKLMKVNNELLQNGSLDGGPGQNLMMGQMGQGFGGGGGGPPAGANGDRGPQPPGGAPQQQQRGPGFQPFQGSGQTLST
ncbi:unnamed protein product [Polarella glacialis]|uniref:Large ribosomal subunit protein uL10-like insertion domain-containing protein n=1 Tax=Polarella glacialis TaxID=89957 RepID=A0A813FW49_POLGL|nr:unnamed protein product [Polarella glacialis]